MDNTEVEEFVQNQTDEQLKQYVDNYNKYRPEYLRAALDELTIRKIEISDKERHAIEERILNNSSMADEPLFEESGQSHLYTNREDAPLLYSKRAIWVFSVIFMPIFGTVLMAQNIKRCNHKGYPYVIIFGVLYTIAGLTLLMQIPRNTGFTLMVNGLGAVILTTVFWNKYIGEDTIFRKRKIWKPLIVAVLITLPFFLAALIYGLE